MRIIESMEKFSTRFLVEICLLISLHLFRVSSGHYIRTRCEISDHETYGNTEQIVKFKLYCSVLSSEVYCAIFHKKLMINFVAPSLCSFIGFFLKNAFSIGKELASSFNLFVILRFMERKKKDGNVIQNGSYQFIKRKKSRQYSCNFKMLIMQSV